MGKSNINIGDVPPIGNSITGTYSQEIIKKQNNIDIAMFDNAPNEVTLGSFFGKVFIGLVVGICVAALLFGTLTAIGGLTGSDDGNINSMIGILLPVVGFVVGFVGNLALAGLYNIFFSKRYYNFGKMFGLIFASSLVIFPAFFLIYLLFNSMSSLYAILGFHIIFALFISINLMDFLSQPNYSASSLMGNALGCILCVIFHVLLNIHGDSNVLSVVFVSIVSYAVIIFGAGIWDAIYYKFYEWGNNPFYLPSLNELREERRKEEEKKAEEEEDVNVDMK